MHGNRLDLAMCDPNNVVKFLNIYPEYVHKIESITDYDFLCTLMEFREIYEMIFNDVSEIQRKTVELSQTGINQREIANLLGVSKQATQGQLNRFGTKIANAYQSKLGVEI